MLPISFLFRRSIECYKPVAGIFLSMSSLNVAPRSPSIYPARVIGTPLRARVIAIRHLPARPSNRRAMVILRLGVSFLLLVATSVAGAGDSFTSGVVFHDRKQLLAVFRRNARAQLVLGEQWGASPRYETTQPSIEVAGAGKEGQDPLSQPLAMLEQL